MSLFSAENKLLFAVLEHFVTPSVGALLAQCISTTTIAAEHLFQEYCPMDVMKFQHVAIAVVGCNSTFLTTSPLAKASRVANLFLAS